MITQVTGKNQITLPSDIVERLGIQRGSRLEWSVDAKGGAGRFRVLPSRVQLAERLHGAGRKHVKSGEDWIKELSEERAQESRDGEGAAS